MPSLLPIRVQAHHDLPLGRVPQLSSGAILTKSVLQLNHKSSSSICLSLPHQTSGIECSSLAFWDSHRVPAFVPADWWLKDVSELDIGLYTRAILAIKVKGAPHELVAESILVYTLKSSPDVHKEPPVGIVALITIEESSSRFSELTTISMCWKHLSSCCLWRESTIVFAASRWDCWRQPPT